MLSKWKGKLEEILNGGQLDLVFSVIIPVIAFLVASFAVSQGELMHGLIWAVIGFTFRALAGPHENEDQKAYR